MHLAIVYDPHLGEEKKKKKHHIHEEMNIRLDPTSGGFTRGEAGKLYTG